MDDCVFPLPDNAKEEEAVSKMNAPALNMREAAKHLVFAVVMGVCGALASILLCLCTGAAFDLFSAHDWLLWGLPLFGAASLLLYKALHLPPDLTTHDVMARMRADEAIPATLAPGIAAGTCLSLLGGASVGREAAALQMGASLGSLLARPFHLSPFLRRHASQSMNGYTAAVGMAATFSALFFAPLGSAVFVIELARFKRGIREHIVSLLIACFIAYAVARQVGIGDIIETVPIPGFSWHLIGQCIVVGALAALFGAITSFCIDNLQNLTKRISRNSYVWVIVGGLAFACLVQFCQSGFLAGSGSVALSEALHGHVAPWDFAMKALLTVVCLGFWLKGGDIMPSFCIGGLLGASCSYLTGGDPVFGAALGTMAFFAAFSACPLGAFLMGCEIFGWNAAPWFGITLAISFLTSRRPGMYGGGLRQTMGELREHLHCVKNETGSE